MVDRDLIRGHEPVERRGDGFFDALHSHLHALSAVAVRITVAQLERLVFAG